jgi:translation elongation factor P/translation initiation factor 5A
MTKANELKRGMKIKIEGRFHKINSVWNVMDEVHVSVNAGSIRFAVEQEVEAK